VSDPLHTPRFRRRGSILFLVGRQLSNTTRTFLHQTAVLQRPAGQSVSSLQVYRPVWQLEASGQT